MSGVLFYVQHLLGIGHLRRAGAIARALRAAGVPITVVSGGEPLGEFGFGDVPVVQLPPCRTSDVSFSGLVDLDGNELGDDWYEARRSQLLDVFDHVAPEMVLLEMFPFGRRKFRFELLPLLERAKERGCLRYTSVREILVRKANRDKEAWMINTARAHMDHVLVHGDDRVCRLEDSLPPAAQLADRMTYTGYVGPDALVGPRQGGDYVTVSAGSGVVGGPLFRAAFEARPLTKYKDLQWRIFCGPNLPEETFQELKARDSEEVRVIRFDPDFPQILRGAAVSISLCGYNTFMEVMAARVPSVVMPFDGGSETEQLDRARMFAEKGLVQLIEAPNLTVDGLAAAVDRAVEPPEGAVALGGAARTAEIIKQRLAARNGTR